MKGWLMRLFGGGSAREDIARRQLDQIEVLANTYYDHAESRNQRHASALGIPVWGRGIDAQGSAMRGTDARHDPA